VVGFICSIYRRTAEVLSQFLGAFLLHEYRQPDADRNEVKAFLEMKSGGGDFKKNVAYPASLTVTHFRRLEVLGLKLLSRY